MMDLLTQTGILIIVVLTIPVQAKLFENFLKLLAWGIDETTEKWLKEYKELKKGDDEIGA